ncbi:hypothetical protein PG5_20180 [Pseudomonas sp. G5(2012)]|nr:hypothetical protein PG5_20180 [Pseudomonas sp. G5(2012)]
MLCQRSDVQAPQTNVGASLLAKAAKQSKKMLTVTTPSRAGSLPQG